MKKKIDSLGRISIPKGMRDRLGWCPEDILMIKMNEKDGVVTIQKEAASCACCGKRTDLISFSPVVSLCRDCMKNAEKNG